MKYFNEDETLLYHILKTEPDARKNNWEAVRMFYQLKYHIDLPKLTGKKTVWSIEREIRTLKSMYKECRDEVSDEIKRQQETEYLEKLLDKNKPIKPIDIKYEDIKIGWW